MNNQSIDSRIKEKLKSVLADYIKEKGMRQTPERYTILNKIIDMNVHFNIDELYERIEPEFHVSRATVYNTVELLCDCKILRKHYFNENQAVYELCYHNHHHLVCNSCGELKVIANDNIDDYLASIKPRGFNPEFSSLTIYGTCSPCNRKKGSQKK